jgi:hypothetical protein
MYTPRPLEAVFSRSILPALTAAITSDRSLRYCVAPAALRAPHGVVRPCVPRSSTTVRPTQYCVPRSNSTLYFIYESPNKGRYTYTVVLGIPLDTASRSRCYDT